MVLGLPTASQTLATACFSQDMYLAASYILIIGFLTSMSSLLSDLLLAAVDPRVRFGGVSAAQMAHYGRPGQHTVAMEHKTHLSGDRRGWAAPAQAG